ncbi:FG-GAP-like repeat-containing protein [Streptomyces sp. NPDC059909]|uniref:FG-GAP-like repeat-containing protein n=1 Tax=Streptomyces sp. NPDC059909 TaxID=3346998 RepID=UPI003659CC06
MRRRALASVLITTCVAAGLLPAAVGTAAAETVTPEVVLDNPSRTTAQLLAAGDTGFLYRQGGRDSEGMLWSTYDGSTTVSVRDDSGAIHKGPWAGSDCYDIYSSCRDGEFGRGGDTVAMPGDPSAGDFPVTLRDMSTGATRQLDSYDLAYQGTFGSVVVAGYHRDSFSLMDIVEGEERTRPVTGFPDAGDGSGYISVTTGDRDGVVVLYAVAEGDYRLGYVDFATATMTEAFAGLGDLDQYDGEPPETVLDDGRIGWYDTAASTLHLKQRTALTAPAATHALAGSAAYGSDAALVDDWLVLAAKSTEADAGDPVTALPLDGGPAKTLLARSGQGVQPAPDGSALVTGGTSATNWWAWRIRQGGDGSLGLTKLLKLAPYETAKGSLAFSRGHLRVGYESGSSLKTNSWNLGTTGKPVPKVPVAGPGAASKCPVGTLKCREIWGNYATGGDVKLEHRYEENLDWAAPMDDDGSSGGGLEFPAGTADGRIVDVSDGYVVYNSGGSAPKQYVGELGRTVQLTGTVRAAALAGPVLWRPTTTAGQLTSYDLRTSKTTSTVTVGGASCVPKELQAAGKWLYWSCGSAGPAGVYDTVKKTSVAVAAGDVLLGDGFTVRHDHASGALLLNDVTSGTAVTRALATLPATALTMDRRYRWAVDEYTGMVAYAGALEQVHVIGAVVRPSTPPTVIHSDVEDGLWLRVTGYTTWDGSWTLSRPAASWTLTIRNTAGKVLRKLTGTDAHAEISASWNGRTDSGAYAPNGRFSWSLAAVPAGGGTSAVTLASGRGTLGDGAAVHRDYFGDPGRPDGVGDLLTLSSSGTLSVHFATEFDSQGLSGKLSGSGWSTSAVPVPVGDLNGDRCSDLLVRLGSELRAYKPKCGAALKPTTSYTSIGTGWSQYNVLTSPGDLTGDGRPDLVARQTTTGDMYLYADDGAGKLKSRVRIGTNWKLFRAIFGAGDLNGDGIGDLLAVDGANSLWRYDGTAAGTVKPRVLVFGNNWGMNRNAFVGVGDLTGDGKPDLVSRNTAGDLLRNSGNGAGSFGATARIGTGWQGYKGLY